MRLRIDPEGGAPLLLPLTRAGCVRLAGAMIASSILDATLVGVPGAGRSIEEGLADALLQGGAGPFLARFAEGRLADGGVEGFPDAATALWLWSRERRSNAGDGQPPLSEDFVAGDAVPGTQEIAEPAWREWLAGEENGAIDLAVATAARWERLRRGDRPASMEHRGGEDTPEGRTLLAAVRLADEHRALAARFAERLAAARIEAIRELAYGAGHEINNPLANIATRAQTLLADERDPERRRRLSIIVDQAFRARDLIGGLMLFARPPRPQPGRVDPDSLVASVVERAAALAAPRGVRVAHRPSPADLAAWVDGAMVEEAIRAVVANAIEAVADGGAVAVEVLGPLPALPGGGDARRRCTIVVSDDGRGMDAAALRRAFDPFFSGREAGRGAGLGLSKAWRFIDVNGGSIALDSRPAGGTRVTIGLPLAPD